MSKNELFPGQGREPARVLEEMGEAIAAAQVALLKGRLLDLEASLLEQRKLCEELYGWVAAQDIDNGAGSRDVEVALTERVRWQSRLFDSVLRKMKANLEMLNRREPALIYQVPVSRERDR